MAFFDLTTNATDANATATLYALVRGLKAKVTRATVQEELSLHPDFPSLLSLSEVLTDWQIDNTALQLNTVEQLRELPLPFIAHLRKNSGWYVLVTKIAGDTITYTDSADGNQTESLTDFERRWSGVVLLAEADERSGEPDYAKKRPAEVRENLRGPFVLTGLLFVLIVAILNVAPNLSGLEWLLLLTKTTGLVLSGLLVAKQLGGKNALTDRLCRVNGKTNCDSVLDSPGAKLWGWLSWSDVGLLYFAGGLLAMLMNGSLAATRPLLNALALLALPYTIYSVYYQARVVEQWCTLCLAVQGVLLVEGILAIAQETTLPALWQPYLAVMTALLLPTLVWMLVKPLLSNWAKSWQEHHELMAFKRNANVFATLLREQEPMMTPPSHVRPLWIGQPAATHILTVVTNPYCRPCARKYKELDELLRQSVNLSVRLIFPTSEADNDKVTRLAEHLLALDPAVAPIALTAWFNQSEFSYEVWASQFPMPANRGDARQRALAHGRWCWAAGITSTPTVFLNEHRFPDLYRLADVAWLLAKEVDQPVSLP